MEVAKDKCWSLYSFICSWSFSIVKIIQHSWLHYVSTHQIKTKESYVVLFQSCSPKSINIKVGGAVNKGVCHTVRRYAARKFNYTWKHVFFRWKYSFFLEKLTNYFKEHQNHFNEFTQEWSIYKLLHIIAEIDLCQYMQPYVDFH